MELLTRKQEKFLFWSIFTLFLLLRLFSDTSYYLIKSGDEARYLALARSFPHHTLDNNRFHVLHPPLFPYLIAILGFGVPDHTAGMLISFLASIGAFFLIYRLGKLLFPNPLIALTALLFYSASELMVMYSARIMKESLIMFLVMGALYFHIRFLKEGKRLDILYSSLFTFACVFTTDLSLFLLIGLVFSSIAYAKKSNWALSALPFLAGLLCFLFWIGVKFAVYSHANGYYPAGFDGIILDTRNAGFKELINANYFPEMQRYEVYTAQLPYLVLDPEYYAYYLSHLVKLAPLPFPDGLSIAQALRSPTLLSLPQLFAFIILPLLCLLTLLIIAFRTLHSRAWLWNWRNNPEVLVAGLFFIFIGPIFQHIFSNRYILNAYPFLYLLFGVGIAGILGYFHKEAWHRNLLIALIVVFLCLVPLYFASHPHLALLREKSVEGENTAAFLESLPGDGIMGQIGPELELNYLMDKRVVGMPIHPDLMFLVDLYGIDYLVHTEDLAAPIESATFEEVNDPETIRYLMAHPEKYEKIASIEENYPSGKSENFSVYEVVR